MHSTCSGKQNLWIWIYPLSNIFLSPKPLFSSSKLLIAFAHQISWISKKTTVIVTGVPKYNPLFKAESRNHLTRPNTQLLNTLYPSLTIQAKSATMNNASLKVSRAFWMLNDTYSKVSRLEVIHWLRMGTQDLSVRDYGFQALTSRVCFHRTSLVYTTAEF